jgi:transcriptional regulator
MFRPPYTRLDNTAMIRRVIEENPLCTVVVVDGRVEAAPVPLYWEGDALVGHVARANPLWRALTGDVLVIGHGPQSYVSPSWYSQPADHVPTWNYVTVQARGRGSLLDAAATSALLDRMVAAHEPEWRTDPALQTQLINAIVGFRIDVQSLDAKAKLSQNRDEADRARVTERFEVLHPTLAAWMRRTT